MPLARTWALALVAALSACAPRPLPPASPLDVPDKHYSQGLAHLEEGDLWAAQSEFERAHALDPDFAGTYVGSGLVALAQGDYWRARQEIETALHKDGDFADAYIARGRVITEQGVQQNLAPGSWLADAMAAYRQAMRLDPEGSDAHFHQGMTLQRAGDLGAARASFAEVIARNRGPLVQEAMLQMERLQQIELASPGTAQGLDIATADRLTRAELAVLLLEELKLAELVEQRRPAAGPPRFRPPTEGLVPGLTSQASDIALSWARPWIETLLGLGLPGLELMPDGTFRPDEPVTRASYARVNEGILELITGDADLTTRYLGQPSPFPDVRGDSFAYNAIALNVDRGIMSADTVTGRFYPEATVSGAEALLIIRELQNAVRMEF
ncbi:S-layer homology domain-containing protein [Candidatus Latescibacterota bacterium]